jgi:hypothetical protein
VPPPHHGQAKRVPRRVVDHHLAGG